METNMDFSSPTMPLVTAKASACRPGLCFAAIGALVPAIRALCWPLLCAVLVVGPCAAQEANPSDLAGRSIEDLATVQVESIYGASKFLQKASDAPTSVTIVTARQIQEHGYRTLSDVLRSVRGFYVINDHNYTYVGVRGLSRPTDYNARILFLLDGHRVNDNIFDGAYVGTEFPVDVDLIERIEIIRGPNSSVYGTGAFAAVINVITQRGRDLGAGETSAEVGSWNSYKGRVTYGDRFDNDLETLVSASLYNSHGQSHLFFPEFNSPATNNGIAENADGDHSYSAFADFIYRDFNIHVVQASRTKHIPTASFSTVFNDPRTLTTDARGYVDIQYRKKLGSWEILTRTSYDWYDYHGIYIYDYPGTGVPPYTQNYDAANGTWWDFQGDVSRAFLKRHQVTLGTEFRQDLQQLQVNYDIQPYFLYLDDHRSARVAALYLQDQYSLRKNFAFVVGLRGDWHENFSTTLSPRLGLLFSPTHTTDVRAIYSSAFRAPNSYEAFYAGNKSNTTNPALKPEKIRSWELNIEQRFAKKYNISAAAFLNRIDGLIEQNIDAVTGRPIYANSTPLQSEGLEWELGGKLPHGFEGAVSHSLQDSRSIRTGGVLANSPKQLVKLNLSIPLLDRRVLGGLDAQYISKRRTIAQTDLGGYMIVNATLLTRRLTSAFDFSAGLYNLFDKRYADSGSLEHLETSIPQDGRSFRIKLTYRRPLRVK
jgi:outer membrane receptor for ferrienterochelin and colicins